jgi:hypothetical protein
MRTPSRIRTCGLDVRSVARYPTAPWGPGPVGRSRTCCLLVIGEAPLPLRPRREVRKVRESNPTTEVRRHGGPDRTEPTICAVQKRRSVVLSYNRTRAIDPAVPARTLRIGPGPTPPTHRSAGAVLGAGHVMPSTVEFSMIDATGRTGARCMGGRTRTCTRWVWNPVLNQSSYAHSVDRKRIRKADRSDSVRGAAFVSRCA